MIIIVFNKNKKKAVNRLFIFSQLVYRIFIFENQWVQYNYNNWTKLFSITLYKFIYIHQYFCRPST